jgi:hypothetical protein
MIGVMNDAYLLGGLVLTGLVFNGFWMLANAPPLIRRSRGLPTAPAIRRWKTPAARRWAGAAQVVGGAGVITEFSFLAANSISTAGADIGTAGVAAMFLCFAAAEWVDYRARRPVSY